MTRSADREKAIQLRKQEKSYSQIKKILGVNKSTLSYWLRDYPLSKERIRELRDHNEQRIEKYRETMRKKKEKRLKDFYQRQKKAILPLNKRELYLAGLFLYWGEGAKQQIGSLSISNTDPAVIKFFFYWLVRILKVPKHKLKVQIHLYEDMNIKKELTFWSRVLNIPLSQFIKPYIKKSSSSRINHKGGFGHGTCNLRIGDVRLTEKILMGIKSVSDYYLKKNI